MPLAQTLTLSDGRVLGFDDIGDPAGAPLLYVHGTPDSRRARHPDDGLAGEAGVRLVAVDRPGAGLSSPNPSGTVGSFGDDAAALAAALGVDRWSILTWSAGSLFGLAVAARHPALVRHVIVAAGLPPFVAYTDDGVLDGAGPDRMTVAELGAELGAGPMAELLAPMVAPFPCDLALAREHVLEGGDEVRLAELAAVPDAVEAMAWGVVDAVSGGLDGLVHDIQLQVEPPDIDLAAVRCPVSLWHGTEDPTSPPSFSRWLAAALPDASVHPVAGGGHCFVLTHWSELLRSAIAG